MTPRPFPGRSQRSRARTIGALLAALTLAPAAPAPAHAAQDVGPELLRAIDALFAWTSAETPGAVVAVARDGERIVERAYGMADLEAGTPMTARTLHDVGSVTKQVVAAAVLMLVEQGRLSLQDDVRAHVPELPDPGHRVTIDHLLTHTSGVRDWVALLKMSRESADALTLVLRQRGLNFEPGTAFGYSNSNYVLLKEIVGRVSGSSFSEFTERHLFEPLGMERSTYAEDPSAPREDLAIAYEQVGESWRNGVLLGDERGGGGGLLSTAGDLLIWNQALTEERLGAFVTKKLQEPARLDNGRRLDHARGLFLDEAHGTHIVWYSGSAGAYKSVVGRYLEPGLSIAIVSNAGDRAEVSRCAARIFDLFVPPTAEELAAEEAREARLEGVEIAGRAGLYLDDATGDALTLVARGERLFVERGPELIPLADDRFRAATGMLMFRSEDRFELRFLDDDALELVSQEGARTRFRRAAPVAPTPDELREVAGRYESAELDALIELELRGELLVGSLNGAPGHELAAVDPDLYRLGPLLMRIERDAAGAVRGLDFTSVMLQHVPFLRVDPVEPR